MLITPFEDGGAARRRSRQPKQATARRTVTMRGGGRPAAAPTAQGLRDLGYLSEELQRVIASVRAQSREALERLVAALAPDVRAIPDQGFLLQARRNAELRHRLLEEHSVLSSGEVAELAGSSASNRAATATRWRHEGRVFGVPAPGTAGEYVYPSFQFTREGQPRAGLRAVIAAFPPEAREWQLFSWLTRPSSWLDGRRPLDVLDVDAAAVAAAAVRELDTARF